MKSMMGNFAAAFGLAAVLSAAAQPAAAADRHVKVVNASSYEITEFHASRSDLDSWQEDILGRRTLLPGDSVNVNVDDGSGSCIYDFKTVIAGGKFLVKRKVNVCKVGTYTIND